MSKRNSYYSSSEYSQEEYSCDEHIPKKPKCRCNKCERRYNCHKKERLCGSNQQVIRASTCNNKCRCHQENKDNHYIIIKIKDCK